MPSDAEYAADYAARSRAESVGDWRDGRRVFLAVLYTLTVLRWLVERLAGSC